MAVSVLDFGIFSRQKEEKGSRGNLLRKCILCVFACSILLVLNLGGRCAAPTFEMHLRTGATGSTHGALIRSANN